MDNKYFWVFLFAASLAGFLLAAFDKLAAIRGKRRVAEKTLFLTAIFFGAFGMYPSMLLFRHKTKHKRFMISLPVMIAAQAAFIAKFALHMW